MECSGSFDTGQAREAASVSLSASFFGEGLESLEARELVLALEALGLRVHLKPRWFEEPGMEGEESRGEQGHHDRPD